MMLASSQEGNVRIEEGVSSSTEKTEKTSPEKTRKIEPFELEKAQREEQNEEDEDGTENLEAALLPPSEQHRRQQKQQKPRVYFQRWIQLGYLSGLAMLSDWICFSVAASKDQFEELYEIEDSTKLIDWFLFTNVVSCFLVTDCVARMGLQRCIRAAAILMAIGACLRMLSSYVGYNYPLVLAGTLMVGAAQPFFQCTPPLLSAIWFASDERATSTAVALNFNQIGIAMAFLVGGPMAGSGDPKGLQWYFVLMAVLCVALAVGTCLQFQAKPPTAPSPSEMDKQQNHNHKEPPFYASAIQFFRTPGFVRALAAFVCSITVTNVVGALIEEVMHRGGIEETWHVALAGGVFEVAIVLGGIVLGGYVDRTKNYKSVTTACLGISIILLLPLGLTEHKLGKEPAVMVISLLLLGFFTGPIQPINAELAVDVTFPGDETAVESTQQIFGNLVSALLMPCAEWAAHQDYQLFKRIPLLACDIRGDVILLVAVTVVTMLYFSGFHAPLKRTKADMH